MVRGLTSWRMFALFALVAWIGLVGWRFTRVEPPSGFSAVALVAVWLGLLTLSSLGGGRLVWRLVAGAAPRCWAEVLVTLGWGAGLLAVAAFALGVAGWLRPAPLFGLLLILAALGAGSVRGLPPLPSFHRSVTVPIVLLLLVAATTVLALPTLSPFYDQLHYHLAFPARWLRTGRLTVFPRHAYSLLPANAGLLYTYALSTLGAWAAQATHWWAGALAVAGIGALAGRIAGPRAGWWAAALFATTPGVAQVATWAASDLVATAFAVTTWLMFVLALERRDLGDRPIWWLLAGCMAGAAVGCKYTAGGIVALPVVLAAMVLPAPSVRARLRRAALVGAGVCLALAPWAVRNALATGDPFYPFGGAFMARLGGGYPGGSAALARAIASSAGGRLDATALATLSTFNPQGEAGLLGPAYLALLPLAAWVAVRRWPPVTAALGVGAVMGAAAWAVGPTLGRYLLPALAPLAALIGAGMQRLTFVTPRPARWALATLPTMLLVWGATLAPAPQEFVRAAATLGLESGEALMRRGASYWPALDPVNNGLPRGAKVLLVGESRCFGIERDVLVEDPFHTPLLVELAEACPSPEAIAARLRGLGVTHLMVNWQEARRIAALNGRSEYLAPLSPEARSRLERFLASCLRLVAAVKPVEVFALERCDQR